MSTEHNMSPLQLWTSGMLQNINSQHTALTVDEMEQYGVDPNESVTVSDEDYQVHIDPPTFALTEEQRMQLPDPFQNDHNTLKVSSSRHNIPFQRGRNFRIEVTDGKPS